MGQPERRASSTRRAPSTPTKPDSVGRPPRSAMRNSFSQRLSRLVRSPGIPGASGRREAFPGVAITARVTNFPWKRLTASLGTRERLCYQSFAGCQIMGGHCAEMRGYGSVAGIPTDTFYGLAADPFNLAAVDEIYRVKGRPETRALPILVNSVDQAMLLSREAP